MEYLAGEGQQVRDRASALGVSTGFHDGTGQWHEVSDESLAAIAAGLSGPAADPCWPAVLVVHRGRPMDWTFGAGEPVHVLLESGAERPLPSPLPGDLPDGYHRIVGRTGSTVLIVVPASCYHPPSLSGGSRAWGWAVQAYALRSRTSWGIGDLGDLATLATDPAIAGEFILINPLNAPTTPAYPGPYRPSSRIFRNPIYLAVEQVPECAALRGAARDRFAELASAGRGLPVPELIDRPAVLRLKDEALRLGFTALDELPGRRDSFESWRATAPLVDAYSTFRVLQDEWGDDWRSWPAEYRCYQGAAVARFAGGHAEELRYQVWLQWLLERQLISVAPTGLGLINDFPIGVAQGGFDAWVFRDEMAAGLTVGAPPDAFAPHGQDWRQAAFSPVGLTSTAYAPFISSIRAALTGAGGVRMDHVMGLSRLFLIPEGGSPADGAYVRFPFEDLLGILALETHRAQALVIGEDLGNVEQATRDRLAAGGVFSSSVVWFERDPCDESMPRPAADYRALTMATVGTHDLATIAGMFTDADLREQVELGLLAPEQFDEVSHNGQHWRQQLIDLLRREELLPLDGADLAAADPSAAELAAVVLALHRFLARTPATLIAARLEDVLEVPRRTNMPGCSTQHRPANWSLPLPATLGELPADPRVAGVVAALRAVI